MAGELARRVLKVALWLVAATSAACAQAERITLLDVRTPFQHLAVVEDTELRERYLYSDERRYLQGMISLRHPDDLRPDYLRSALIGLAFAPESPSSMLFVGLGTGSLPRYLSGRYPRARLDAVEIDPEVPPIARRYFALRAAKNVTVIVREGREFVREQTARYDLVLVDAYFGAEIPPQLSTREFLGELRRALTRDGVVVANLPAPEVASNFWSVLATYRTAFPNVRVFATHSRVNFVLVATGAEGAPDSATIERRIRRLKATRRIDVDLAALAALEPPWKEVPADAPELRDPLPR